MEKDEEEVKGRTGGPQGRYTQPPVSLITCTNRKSYVLLSRTQSREIFVVTLTKRAPFSVAVIFTSVIIILFL